MTQAEPRIPAWLPAPLTSPYPRPSLTNTLHLVGAIACHSGRVNTTSSIHWRWVERTLAYCELHCCLGTPRLHALSCVAMLCFQLLRHRNHHTNAPRQEGVSSLALCDQDEYKYNACPTRDVLPSIHHLLKIVCFFFCSLAKNIQISQILLLATKHLYFR